VAFHIRYATEAQDDIDRLFDFWLEQDVATAMKMLEVMDQAAALLQTFPFSCRKVFEENYFLRELLIPFGSAGYVALFEIEDNETITILAVRHQREEDFH
jgi:plasmid stabilization system protein ParE